MYSKDILGDEFECFTIPLEPDHEGKNCCTLIRLKQEKRFSRSVLYIHGFSDYFFQKELALKIYNSGFNFYALDLRKCGRSMRAWQTPYYVRCISEYFEDINEACKVINGEAAGGIVCLAHSTGGLTAALYADKNKDVFEALVLNSPFLEMNQGFITKKMLIPAMSVTARFFPYIKIKKAFSPFYGQSVHKDFHGEWDFDTAIKPVKVPYVWSGWLRAVHQAHKAVKKGLNIEVPVLVMRSSVSVRKKKWGDEFFNGDAVLNVNDIDKYARKLGGDVSVKVIKNGMHDLFLSRQNVREEAYRVMFEWFKKIKQPA